MNYLQGQGDSNEAAQQQNQSLISIEHQNGFYMYYIFVYL